MLFSSSFHLSSQISSWKTKRQLPVFCENMGVFADLSVKEIKMYLSVIKEENDLFNDSYKQKQYLKFSTWAGSDNGTIQELLSTKDSSWALTLFLPNIIKADIFSL